MPPNCHPQILYAVIARKYGLEGIWYLDTWPVVHSAVVLTDPVLLDQVAVTKPLRQHAMSSEFLAPMIGDNIVAAVNGPVWKRLHSALSPAFSWSHIRTLTGLMVDQSVIFRGTLDKLAATNEVFSMEEVSMKLIFDVIALLVFNFPLHAQTKGSSYLDDLRQMIALAEGELDLAVRFNPVTRVKRFFQRRKILSRLHPPIEAKIEERFNLLLRQETLPSRKDPTSILDLMLREMVLSEKEKGQKTGSAHVPPADMKLLRDKYALFHTRIKSAY